MSIIVNVDSVAFSFPGTVSNAALAVVLLEGRVPSVMTEGLVVIVVEVEVDGSREPERLEEVENLSKA